MRANPWAQGLAYVAIRWMGDPWWPFSWVKKAFLSLNPKSLPGFWSYNFPLSPFLELSPDSRNQSFLSICFPPPSCIYQPIDKTPSTSAQLGSYPQDSQPASLFRPSGPMEEVTRPWNLSLLQKLGHVHLLVLLASLHFEPGVLHHVPCLTSANHWPSRNHLQILNSVQTKSFCPRL